MDVTPDTKDWTWVLDRPCPECGVDTREIDRSQVGHLLRKNAADWQAPLSRSEATQRPSPGVWSPLEYGCHVRDVFVLYDERLTLMLTEDNPTYPNWDQDETAIANRYGEQDPAAIAAALLTTGQQIGDHFDSLTDEQWERTGRRSDGAVFTVDTFSRYLVHDVLHHIVDVSHTTDRDA